eukprot:TRINITY_DN3458_c0_g1_i3.p1 TRINITY_DN3458_c0_g1~~TRINITY_DN3458_c0_g1_i3.p1  ORF type:complete len:229 (+),score=47.57 TRINITY_DN3458_c0_g1_i3:507-1193(+)
MMDARTSPNLGSPCCRERAGLASLVPFLVCSSLHPTLCFAGHPLASWCAAELCAMPETLCASPPGVNTSCRGSSARSPPCFLLPRCRRCRAVLQGLRLADKYALKHEPRLVGDLQVVKWLCKDFWQRSFGKDIDALKTDYQGTFLLCDNSFSALQPFLAGAYTKEQLLPYLAYPCGLVRGALSSLGVEANVAPELETLEDRTVRLPKCSFRISVKRATEDTTATAAQP